MTDYACRICSSTDHDLVLDFGDVVLADAFLESAEQIPNEERYPLTLVVCRECLHVQIKEVLDPSLLFSHYIWETGIPASIRAYCREFADATIERLTNDEASRILEVASNDGTMLKEYRSRGWDVIGVDPAQNIAAKANANGIKTVADFFGLAVAERVLEAEGRRDLVVARNVIAHVADLHGLVEGIRVLLADDGVAVIEAPHLLTMFEELQYDQVFHEHIGYHSLDSVIKVLAMHGLAVFDVETPWIHGGSIRVYAAHEGAGREPSAAVRDLLAKEEAAGILSLEGWRHFGERAERQRALLRKELEELKAAGKMVVGYGASAKGQCMIQFCGLDEELIAYVADKSDMKIGMLCPGSHIPIVSPERMRSDPVDAVVVFAWNFAQEILRQEDEMRERGVRFIHPIPEPHYM